MRVVAAVVMAVVAAVAVVTAAAVLGHMQEDRGAALSEGKKGWTNHRTLSLWRMHKSVRGWIEGRAVPYKPISTITTSGKPLGAKLNDFPGRSAGQRPLVTFMWSVPLYRGPLNKLFVFANLFWEVSD